jgi:hypothetical protein
VGLPDVDSPERTESMMNKGLNRTPEKRELLRRSSQRAIAAAVKPIKAYYRGQNKGDPGLPRPPSSYIGRQIY